MTIDEKANVFDFSVLLIIATQCCFESESVITIAVNGNLASGSAWALKKADLIAFWARRVAAGKCGIAATKTSTLGKGPSSAIGAVLVARAIRKRRAFESAEWNGDQPFRTKVVDESCIVPSIWIGSNQLNAVAS